MRKKSAKILLVLTLLGTILTAPAFKAEAQESPAEADFLRQIRQELNLSKADYRQLLNKVSDTKARLVEITEEELTLQAQLANLDAQIELTTAKLLEVLKQVVEKENEIRQLFEEIEVREVAMEYQKSLLLDYIQIMYQEEKALLDIKKDGSIDAFKMLLAEGTVGENLRQLNYLSLLGQTGQQIIDKMDSIHGELIKRQGKTSDEKVKLDLLRVQLGEEKKQLELQKDSKEKFLKVTRGQEKIYAQLLEQTVEEQEEMIEDVKNLSIAVKFIEEKIKEEGADFDPSKYADILDTKTQILYDFYASNPVLEDGKLAWPIEPDLGISAYFRDPTYVGVFGVQHQAIDIPAYQGTPIRAAASGVVYSAKDNGYGYSYIILSHAGGIMTVYGHVNKILVEEGQTVPAGFVIGLSGGMPGTKGAGYMTTGPHLHLEVLLNGQHRDPLDYLPFSVFSAEQLMELPEKYQARLELLSR